MLERQSLVQLTENGHNDDKDEVDILEQNEQVEVRVVLNAHTIVHPLTMMVETLDTHVADVAVARVSCAEDFTVRAEQVGLKVFNKAYEGYL